MAYQMYHCRLCNWVTTTHYSLDCPTGTKLYHATRLPNIQGIVRQSLIPSSNGRLGSGVYFTDDFEVAKEISQKFGKEGAVFECNVNLGILKNLGLESGSTWQYEGFDSATAMHPPWFGLNTGWFREYCLKDRTKCSLRNVTLTTINVDGITDVIDKSQKGWKELMKLKEEPTSNNVIAILKDPINTLSKTNFQFSNTAIFPQQIDNKQASSYYS